MLEMVAQALCGATLLLWVLIASFSRSDLAEHRAQLVMRILSLAAAAVLAWMGIEGIPLWGSTYLPKPLALLCLIFALLAHLNIKGRDISRGMNPHQIMKATRAEEE